MINSPTNRGTSEGSETSEHEYSTRRIQICVVYFCLGIIWKIILEKKSSKTIFTKVDQTDLDSSHRELSNGGLNITVALTAFWGIIFLCDTGGAIHSYARNMCTCQNKIIWQQTGSASKYLRPPLELSQKDASNSTSPLYFNRSILTKHKIKQTNHYENGSHAIGCILWDYTSSGFRLRSCSSFTLLTI